MNHNDRLTVSERLYRGHGDSTFKYSSKHLHLGVPGKAPEEGVDEGLGHVLLQLVRLHGEVHVLVVVQQDVPHLLPNKRRNIRRKFVTSFGFRDDTEVFHDN